MKKRLSTDERGGGGGLRSVGSDLTSGHFCPWVSSGRPPADPYRRLLSRRKSAGSQSRPTGMIHFGTAL